MTSLKDRILAIIRENPDKYTRRDLARELKIKGDDRRELRSALRDMVEQGILSKSDKKKFREAGELPSVLVLRVIGTDSDGDLYGEPDKWKEDGPPPRILIVDKAPKGKKKSKTKTADLGPGARALCRLKSTDHGRVATVIKTLGSASAVHLGVLSKDGRGWIIKPTSKKARHDLRPVRVPEHAAAEQLVEYRTSGARRGNYERKADILRVIGKSDDPKMASLISLEEHGIPIGFDKDVIAEAQRLKLPKLDKYREDLRDIPLITIDPVDAKDFDDAIHARPDERDNNNGGWIVWVAIADVAAFVNPGSKLDKSAWNKGNSCYLPDRVEPMLPEELSADLCSLRPNEDRACMAVKMRFQANGDKIEHEFKRGIMRSHARLTYEQAQEAFDGNPGDAAEPVKDVLENIWGAYESLRAARQRRHPLAIDLPERQVHVNDQGNVTDITVKDRFDANKLIEEFMVQANVAAAEALDKKKVTTIVRNHEPPAREKLVSLSDFLPALGLKYSPGDRTTTLKFNNLLEKAAEKDLTEAVGMAVLRSQSQAYYGTDPKGHFGLNLTHYAHFTSPIRRYADLVVHRALIRTFNLGHDGTTEEEMSRLKETAEHISDTERRAMAAERDAKDRYVADYLKNRVGAEFDARINGAVKAGLFVTLDETGADGFIPARTLGKDYYLYDEKTKSLTNIETGGSYRFGRRVKVKLMEATPVSGGLIFEMLSPPEKGRIPGRNPRGGKRKYKGRGKRKKK